MSNRVFAVDVTFQDGATGTGNGTAVTIGGLTTVGLQVVGITNATVTCEGTLDGTNWVAIQVVNLADGSLGTSTTADGLFLAPVAGLGQLRCRVSAYVAGTITVTGKIMVGGWTAADGGVDNPASAAAYVRPGTGATWTMAANDGVDVGDVTVNNAAGSGAYVQPGTSTSWDDFGQVAAQAGNNI